MFFNLQHINLNIGQTIVCILMVACLTNNVQAQEYSERFEDAELWTAVTLTKNLNKKIRFSARQALRFDNNVTEVKNTFSQFAARYRLLKSVSITGKYRYIVRSSIEQSHRMMLALSYRHKFHKRFNMSYRFQAEHNIEDRTPSHQRYRNRVQAEYSPRKSRFTPYALVESFYSKSYQFSDLDRWRYGLGTEIEITKDLSFDASFLLQREINVEAPVTDYISSFSLSYKL